MALDEMIRLVQAGGNVALLVSVYYMMKIAGRLARIDAHLDVLIYREGLRTLTPKENNHV